MCREHILRPLPPFGNEAAFLLSMGVQPRNDIFIFAGINAGQKAKAFEKTQVVLCLPPNENPLNYFWPVAYCAVLLFDTGNLTAIDLDKTAYCFLCANAVIVRAVQQNNTLIIYGRDSHD